MKVYIVTEGEYSDKSNIAVFDEDHLAEARRVAELIGGDVNEDESFELNHFDIEEPPGNKLFYRVVMSMDGKCQSVLSDFPLSTSGNRKQSSYDISSYDKCLYVSFYADSTEHAVKVANELRSRILAGALPPKNNEWKV